jgi:SNF2 family DNA or RNA helicase
MYKACDVIYPEDDLSLDEWMPLISTALFFESQDSALPSFSSILHYMACLGWEKAKFIREKKGGIEGYSAVKTNTPGCKIQWLEKLLLSSSSPLVVGARSVNTLDMVQGMLVKNGLSYRLIRGGINSNTRTDSIQEFQDDKVRVMLLQQVAGSESVTLTNACNSVLIDHDWSAITYTQFLARTCRRGQTKECNHYDLVLGPFQTAILQKLRAGERFDDETRTQIEAIYNQWKDAQ